VDFEVFFGSKVEVSKHFQAAASPVDGSLSKTVNLFWLTTISSWRLSHPVSCGVTVSALLLIWLTK